MIDEDEDDDGITLTDEQEACAEAVDEWLRDPNSRKDFRLAGCAGTGKSIMAKKIGDRLDNRVLYATFTNKAAHVLEQKGCRGLTPPTTIHRLIYKPKDDRCIDVNVLDAIIDGVREAPRTKEEMEWVLFSLFERAKDRFPHEPESDRVHMIAKLFRTMKPSDVEQRIIDEIENPQFYLNQKGLEKKPRLIIIDESSVVTKNMADDLLALDYPVLFIGDPAQLPPITKRNGPSREFFNLRKPDFTLNEIHRQAKGSPIIKLASIFRDSIMNPTFRENPALRDALKSDSNLKEHQLLARGTEVHVYSWRRRIVEPEMLLDADIILVGTHDTRKWLNAEVRMLKGFNDPLPMVGDKLICTKTRMKQNIFKGSIWFVETFEGWLDSDQIRKVIETQDETGQRFTEIEEFDDEEASLDDKDEHGMPKRYFRLLVTPGEAQGDYTRSKSIILDREMFEDRNAKIAAKKGVFDYGYAITVNAAQGSQWDNVMMWNECGYWRQDAHRWLYTAITRAAKRLTVIQ